MKRLVTLHAGEGKVLTDGTHYGTVIFLAEGADESAYYEIPKEEYDAIMAEQEKAEATV